MTPTFRPEDWKKHTQALRRMARELLGEEHLAEDLVQTAWLVALERPPRVLSLGWLKRVLRTRAQDVHRKRGRVADVERRSRIASGPPEAPEPCEIVQQLETHEILATCVKHLDEPYREVVFLRYFENLRPTEIARRLELPVKTVKTRLHRALAQLRQRLEGQYEDGVRWQAALVPFVDRHVPLATTPPAEATLVGIGATIMLKKLALLGAVLLGFLGLRAFWNTGVFAGPDGEPRPLTTHALAVVAEDEPDEHRPILEANAERRRALESDAQPAELPSAEQGSVRVRVVWFDGRPAADVGVAFQTRSEGLPTHGILRVVTDKQGIARAEGLPVGPIQLESDRGDRLDSEVVGGEEVELRLELAERLDVEGTVVDAQGRAVADAGIWLTSGRDDWLGGRVVTRSDARGAFFVRSMRPDQSLGALASGFEPSSLIDLDGVDKTRPPARVQLKLLARGGAVRVRVTAAGAPVPAALVAFGDSHGRGGSRIAGGQEERWTPRARACDADGHVLLEGLPAGEQALSVRADRYPILNTRARITAGETTELELALRAGVTLSGVVRDGTGAPLAQAVVRIFDAPIEEDFIQGGQYDHDSAFGYPLASTDANGAYRIESVAPGTLHMYAAPQRGGHAYGSRPHAHRVEEAAPGTHVVWDVDLPASPSIAGKVLFADGEPMPHVFLTATNEESTADQVTTTVEDGGFAFYNLRPAPYTLRVQFWDAPPGAPLLTAEHVWPAAGELLLTAGFPKPVEQAPAEVRFRFHDKAQRLAHADVLLFALHAEGLIFRTDHAEDGDQYVFRGLKSGKRKLDILSGEDMIYTGEWFELMPGEVRDLGTVETEGAGALEIRLERPVGGEALEPRVWIQHEASNHGRWLSFGKDSVRLAENLNPGAWSLSMYGDGFASTWTEADVKLEQTTSLSLGLRLAVARELLISYHDDVNLKELHLQVHHESGHQLWDFVDRRPTDRGRPYRRTLNLPLGRIDVSVSTDAGVGGSLELAMTSLEPEQDPVRIQLR